MGNAPVGDQPGVVLMGPMDLALQGATDVLLKSIEEFDPDLVRPVLWAHDETEVSSTIRSRCLRRWCPGQVLNDEDSMMRARELVDEALEGHRASVVELLKDQDPRLTLESVAAVLGERVLEGATRPLWDQVREALSVPHPTPTEALAALLFEEGRP